MRPLSANPSRRRRRDLRLLVTVGLLVATFTLAASTVTGASTFGAASRHASNAPKPLVVKSVKHGRLGTILETSSGFTLYHFTPDTPKKLACTGGCAQAWPPLMLPKGVAHATAGRGVKQALLGTRKRGTGLQVTYKGLPLYRYSGDAGPGQTNGQGVGGTWFVVKAA